MRRLVKIAVSTLFLFWLLSCCIAVYGQVSNIPTRRPSGVPAATQSPAPAALAMSKVDSLAAPLVGVAAVTKNDVDFGDDTAVGTIKYKYDITTVTLAAGDVLTVENNNNNITADIPPNTYTGDAKTQPYHDFQVAFAPAKQGSPVRMVMFAFSPSFADPKNQTTTTIKLDVNGTFKYQFDLKGKSVAQSASPSGTTCIAPRNTFLPLSRVAVTLPGTGLSAESQKVAEDLALKVTRQLGDPAAADAWEASINCFYSTNNSLSWFTQVKSAYNGASSSATITASIGTYNFRNGMQLSLGTNIQAGSSGTGAAPVNGMPVLAATGAAQAAQNLFYGGNFYLSGLYPIIQNPTYISTRLHYNANLLAREGVDLQNFTSGTNTTANNPNSHFNALMEGYIQYDAIPTDPSSASPMAIFLGAEYGYAYTSAGYARQYGFGKNTSSQIGDISLGVLVNGQFTVAVVRQFGPSQTYIDSTTNMLTHINNFHTLSFSIWYQNKGLGSSSK